MLTPAVQPRRAQDATARHRLQAVLAGASTTALQLQLKCLTQAFRHLEEATDDWNNPTAATKSVHLTMGFGGTDPATCAPVLGRIEVCNAAYGDNGWLGLAQVWVYRGKDKHIAQATALLNDTYYADGSSYDSYAWRQLVVCQEIAHDFGLDHQDENFSNPNLGTCMDYTAAPGGGGAFGSLENTHPNQHDYDQLATLYAHLAGGGSSGAVVVAVVVGAVAGPYHKRACSQSFRIGPFNVCPSIHQEPGAN